MNSMIQFPHTHDTNEVWDMEREIEWISTLETAELLGITLSSVSRLCRDKKINCRQHGTGQRSVWEVDKASAIAYKNSEKNVGGRPRKVG